jgi:FkbM family methyltransferase
MFRDRQQPRLQDIWKVDVAGVAVTMPLRGAEAWLDWDLAMSLIGHELEIKQTYLYLLRDQRPSLFLDVGANYGLHSLLFLSHGVPAVSFEPNPACHDYLRTAAQLNHLSAELQPVALGAIVGSTDLVFPEGETWLGSSEPEVRERLVRSSQRVTRLRVPQTTLDEFLRRDGRRPDLIKIDTEGNEAAVLEGARDTLRTARPLVIFESWRDTSRDQVFFRLDEAHYRIYSLPYRPTGPGPALDLVGMRQYRDTNLIAVPAERGTVSGR